MTVLAEDAMAGKDFDTASIESNGLSLMTLQNIREQMALSLKRMKQLEEQVKFIPLLEMQLDVLKTENMKLSQRREEENFRLNDVHNVNNNNLFVRSSFKSFTDVDGVSKEHRTPPPPPPRRDFGVMCGVLTRNVGVGHQVPNTKSVSIDTQDIATDKWYNKKTQLLMNGNKPDVKTIVKVAKDTQTCSVKCKDIEIQADNKVIPNELRSCSTQTIQTKTFCSVGISNVPSLCHFGVQVSQLTKSIGCSEDKIDSNLCAKCNVKTRSCGIMTDGDQLQSVSLASLNSINTKPDEETDAIRSRTIGCQYQPSGKHKHTQCDFTLQTKSTQIEVKTDQKYTQYDSFSIARDTDTSDLLPKMIDVGCCSERVKTVDASANTPQQLTCVNCAEKEMFDDIKKDEGKVDVAKKEDSPLASKIPRLQHTPTEKRKFERQITYTKVQSSQG